MTQPDATILIPAYNEGTVIARCLRDLTAAMAPGEFQIIVIPNACKDDTADQARAAWPLAEVIETQQPGKTNAMNLGFARAKGRTVVCLDADLSVPAEHIRALIAPLLAGQARAACGKMRVDLTGCSAAVRAFYGAWQHSPYFDQGKFGGLWALSADAAAQVFPLPAITADDEFVSRSFAAADKAYVPDCQFTVRAPRDLRSLIAIRRRSLRGTRQVARMGLAADARRGGALRTLTRRILPRPRHWPGFALYIFIMAWVRLRVTLEPPTDAPRWERDLSSRNQDV